MGFNGVTGIQNSIPKIMSHKNALVRSSIAVSGSLNRW